MQQEERGRASGRCLERFSRRMTRLRAHHGQCERRISAQEQDRMASSTQLVCGESDTDSSELSINTGSDKEYQPVEVESSSSDDEDLNIQNKLSTYEASCSDEDPKSLDPDAKKVQGKCTFQKQNNPINYMKRKNKKQKMEITVKTVTIKTCTKKKDGKRSWDKKHYCLYCESSTTKMARHLQRKHNDIKDVAYALSFPLGSKERRVLLEQLRNKGDFKHNTKVLEEGRGEIVTWKQPSHSASIKDYLPCPYCYGMFIKTELWKHRSSCRSKEACATDDGNETNTRRRVQSRAARLLPIATSSRGCQNIVNNMRQDAVSFHIRNDNLICRYGESLYAKHGRVRSKHQYISQRMRELGRFMLAAKDMDKTVKSLEDLCTPSKFHFVVNVAKRLTEFSPGKNEFGKPSTVVKIGFCLKGAVEVLIGQTLMNDDDLAEKRAKKFLELLEKNWKNHVSVSAHQTIQEKRWNKQDDIPLTKDVMTLRDHLMMVEDKAREELIQQPSLMAFKMLNESVLAQVIIFNKRREGEASRLTLETYNTASTNPINEDIYQTLSPLERELSKLLTRIEIRGKRGRKVPVFLTARMIESIDLLIKRRDEAGVPAENPYLFARPGAMTNIRGCDCLRKHAEESKADHPELLRSTKLRKQVATLCQLLDLNEQELEQVAKFMGHDIRVHRDFYRQTDKTFQIAKISKLLFAMEKGTGALMGKNLNTIDLSGCGEHSMSTSETVQQIERKSRKEVDDDGCSDLFSPKKRPNSCSEDESSRKDDGSSDLISSRKRHFPCMGDCSSDSDDLSPGTSLPKKKKGRKRKAEKKRDGGLDLFSPQKRASLTFEVSSDSEDEIQLASLDKKVQQHRNKGKQKKVKERDLPKVIVKRPWSEQEKKAVRKHLGKFIAEHRVPGKKDCTQAVNAEEILRERSWKDVKNWVYNTITTLNRRAATKRLF